jgi:hypothetical protein
MSLTKGLLVVAAFILLLSLPVVAFAQQQVVIRGQVQYLESPLPSTAILWVSLDDATTGARLITLANQGVVGGKQQPFSYSMQLASNRVVAGARYRVVAEISDTAQSTNRRYAGVSQPFAIAATGTTNAPAIRATYMPARLGSPGAGTLSLVLALVLAGLAGMIALWRRSRARPLVRQPA